MIKNNLIKISSKQNIDLMFVFISFTLAIYLDWSFESAIALTMWIYSVLSDFRPDLYKIIAIIFGFFSAIALSINDQAISEKLGIISFVYLLTHLFFTLIEVRKNS